MGYLAGRHVAFHRPVVGVPYPILLSMMGFACWFLLIQTAGSWIPAFRVVGLPAALCLALASARLYGDRSSRPSQGGLQVWEAFFYFLMFPFNGRATGWPSLARQIHWRLVFQDQTSRSNGHDNPPRFIIVRLLKGHYRSVPTTIGPNQQLELIVNGQVMERSYAQRVQQAVNAVVPCGLQSDATDIAILGMRAGLLAGYVSGVA